MVRAGRSGRFADEFRDRSIVALGWSEIDDLSNISKRDEVLSRVRIAYPSYSEQSALMAAGQLFRFVKEFKIGDRIVSYDPRVRQYLCGEIVGNYRYCPDEANEELINQRDVKWQHERSRDDISSAAKNSLGAISTIFLISDAVVAELWGKSLSAIKQEFGQGLDQTVEQPDFEQLASETIKDRIAALDWAAMQNLVAGLLRAMGYKTSVSEPGSDRGKDIVASPDGFGFQEPRIVVEVKHRKNQRMGSQEIRSFLGGRHPRDKGLFVSTGGFSKDAFYEAERANISITLMDFESLVEAILEHYPRFDQETKQLLPLKTIYWPID
jgi:restriction system protein